MARRRWGGSGKEAAKVQERWKPRASEEKEMAPHSLLEGGGAYLVGQAGEGGKVGGR